MPGPKMGPRPKDFDEDLVRRSPTFRKWEGLLPGGKLRYACRDFVKGEGDDEERLMRRIMIARRNNVRDHQALKWARRMQSSVITNGAQPLPRKDPIKEETVTKKRPVDASGCKKGRAETEAIISRTSLLLPVEQEPPRGRRTRRPTTLISEEAIKEEMDVAAVEKTRSYKIWMSMPDGTEFLYNQKYIKGHEAHDWLLKKNIWRRMRYRRENKKMVEEMLSRERVNPLSTAQPQQSRKRCHDKTGVSSAAMDSTNKIVRSNKSNAAIGDTQTILVNYTTRAPTAVGMTAGTNVTNREDVVASTASEIVDHALLSTNTNAQAIVPGVDSSTGNSISISIGDSDQQQQLQNETSLAHPVHHHQQHESAEAYAASIALAGVRIGTGGDLNSHHDAAVADSAAVQAAVVAALAATDVDSSSYHNNQHHSLMDFDHVVHGGNGPLESPPKTREVESHSVLPSTTASVAPKQASPAFPSQDGVVTGLGLALDAAAKLAAAAAVDTCDSVKTYLLPTTAITAAVEPAIPVGKASGDGNNGGDDVSSEAADASMDQKS